MRGDLIVQTQLHMAQSFGALADLVTNSTGYALTPVAFALLPSEPRAGMLACITDSTVTGGNITVGGGTNLVLAWHNGDGWKVIGA